MKINKLELDLHVIFPQIANFSKARFIIPHCQKLYSLVPLNHLFADKTQLSVVETLLVTPLY